MASVLLAAQLRKLAGSSARSRQSKSCLNLRDARTAHSAAYSTRERDKWGVADQSSETFSRSSEAGLAGDIRRLRYVKDHFSFFSSKRDVMGPGDVCLLLNSLWSHAMEENSAEGLAEARRSLFNDAGFMPIMKDIVFKLERYGSRELPNLLSILHEMHWHDKHLFKIAEPMVIRNLPSVELPDLPRLATSYVAARCGSRMLFNELVHRCSEAAGDFEPDAISVLVGAFARSPHKPKIFLIGFSPIVCAKMHLFSHDELAKVVSAYSEWPRDVSPELAEKLTELLSREDGSQLALSLSPGHLVSLLRALVLWRSRAKSARANPKAWNLRALARVFRNSARVLLDGREQLSPEHAAAAMWAYGKIGSVPQNLYAALYQDVTKSFKRLNIASLASCLLNSARVASGQLPVWSDDQSSVSTEKRGLPCDTKLLEVAESRVQKEIEDLAVRDITSVTLAYCLSHCGSPELFSVLQRFCLERCRQFPTEQIATLLWSFATIRLGPSFFKEAQFDILERINQLSVPAVCDVLWAYCASRHRDPQFFKALLSVLAPSKVAGNPRCALLYPALLDISTHFPHMDPEGLERYMEYSGPDFRRAQQALAAPADVLQSLSDTVAALELQHCEMLADLDGYVVDLLIQEGNPGLAKPVVVLYHSAPRTLHLRTKEPLGQTMMRQRHLRGRGFGVVNLLDSTWDELDHEQRCSLLSDKILQAQKQPTGYATVSAVSHA